ncbi:MAG: hypothetical protein RJA99_35 [Pseudomonadota bacterium]|jgi:peptidoglycan/LPS O-acetylase OafA/YrhL
MDPTHPPRDHGKNTDVEVLRAAAILFTLAAHWGHGWLGSLGPVGRTIQSWTAFATGVDLFFCISGFVIADSLLRQPIPPFSAAGFKVWVSAFWVRRAFRLLPSAWFWIALTLAATAFVLDTTPDGQLTARTWVDTAWALLNVINLHYIACTPAHTCGTLGVYWSLSLEEQFYLVLPTLLFLVRSRTAIVVLLAVLCAIQLALPRVNGFLADGSSLWFIRTDAIILGVLIAYWRQTASYGRWDPHRLSSRALGTLAALAGLAGLAVVTSPRADAGWGTSAAALCSAVLVWIASYDRDYLMAPGRLKSVMLWFGSRSYALYLIHMLVLAVCYELTRRALGKPLTQVSPVYGVAMIAATAVITFAAAEFNFRVIESPLRARGRRIAAGIEARARAGA